MAQLALCQTRLDDPGLFYDEELEVFIATLRPGKCVLSSTSTTSCFSFIFHSFLFLFLVVQPQMLVSLTLNDKRFSLLDVGHRGLIIVRELRSLERRLTNMLGTVLLCGRRQCSEFRHALNFRNV